MLVSLAVLAVFSVVASAAAGGGLGSQGLRAPDKPITASGKVKNLNRDVELAIDPATGNGLAVWNRSKRSQNFGEIWAAEIVRQNDGTYQADKAFKVSSSKPAQRPTVEFLPDFGYYAILWDSGPKDPGKASKPSRIVSRLYEPKAATSPADAAPGDLAPEVNLTPGSGTNLAPGLAFHGLITGIYEELFFGWWESNGSSAGMEARPRGGYARRKRMHGTKSGRTLTGDSASDPPDTTTKVSVPKGRALVQEGSSSPDLLARKGDRICWLRALESDGSPVEVQFGLTCFDPVTLQGSFTPLGDPTPGGADDTFGSLREDGGNTIRAVTSAGAFDVDPDGGSATSVPFSLNPMDVFGAFFGASTASGRVDSRPATDEGFVYIRPPKGKFEYRGLMADGDLAPGRTKLWKLKRNRFLDMDVVRAGDTVLVAWAEAKNKRGTKSTIKLGWFVPE